MGFRKKKTLLEQAKDQATEFADNVRPQIEAAVSTAREKSGPVIADARDKAAPYLADARDKAAPYIEDAKEKAAPYLADAKDKVSEGKDLAAAKALIGLQQAEAKVASLQSEPEKKKGSKLRKLFVFGLLAGGAAFAVKVLQGKKSGDDWQSTYTPPPPPAPAPAPAPDAASTPPPPKGPPLDGPAPDEAGGASPDEVLADTSEAPHPVTTPDEPAEVVEINDDKA